MLTLYFRDMFEVLRQAYGVLEDNGFCSIVVGNSSYGGVVFQQIYSWPSMRKN